MATITLRPKQAEILNYRRGRMGISAVPGSGKTWTLSLLAAELILRGQIGPEQEVLLVTLVNSAVDNFNHRVSAFIRQGGMPPHTGYRVRTLHGLAHDIVRERPDLVRLAENFQIIDEREADAIRDEVAEDWLSDHPFALDRYFLQDLEEDRGDWVRREQLPDLINEIARSFVRYAKDLRLTPEALRERIETLPVPLPLAEMGLEIYAAYQRALEYRGAVDFDDLVRLALQALQVDPQFLERLRQRWPYILEDEAQDSSRLQQTILEKLVGPQGNWVRVGDPNQAIYETFTTADPRFFRQFLERKDVYRQDLPNSGRSTPGLIRLANHLIRWTQSEHPVQGARDALQAPPFIEPTPAGDPQPNPPEEHTRIYLSARPLAPQEEIQLVAESLARWLPDNPDKTVAVLVPRNIQGFELVDELRRRGLDPVDSLLRSTTVTRLSAGVLANLLRYLADPQSATKLATVYRVWRRQDRADEQSRARMERAAGWIRKIPRVEEFVSPVPGQDWLEASGLANQDPELALQLSAFRSLVQRWLEAALLPPDQLLIALSQDLLREPTELAVAHKLAVLMREVSEAHPAWRLPELTEELWAIARNERRFLGLSEEDTGFDPDRYKGQAVVGTMHKAKGLEWDRVYLMSVNNYDFPSSPRRDQFISEKWFIRDNLNLDSEALAQLEAAARPGKQKPYQEGRATQSARMEYVRERLRLLYVGITRAREELMITWNTGREGELQPALPLQALQKFWEKDQQ